MGKTPIVLFGISASWAFGLGCQSEGKIPFGDDTLAPGDDSSGQGGNGGNGSSSGASGRGGTGMGGTASPIGGSGGTSGGRGGSSGAMGSSGVGGSSGRGGSSGIGGSSGFGGSSAGRSGSGSIGDPDVIGQACEVESDCRSFPGAYCANAYMCVATCVTHTDCGCPEGTVNTDIADGACSAACITYDEGSFCQRVCNSSANCDGDTACVELDFYGVCAPQ